MHILVAIDYAFFNPAIGRLATSLAATESVKTEAPLLSGAAELIAALAWPTIAAILLITQRRPLEKLIGAIVSLAESANKIKIWLLEVERQITQEVNRSEVEAQAAPTESKPPSTPTSQADAAKRVGRLIDFIPAPSARDKVLQSVKENMEAFAAEYETIREAMPASSERTRAMNGVAAKMRTLAIAAKPFLAEFTVASSAGKRLAAVCILEISPDLSYLNWLVDRMKSETPFVFYHASIALAAMARNFGGKARGQLSQALQRALETVRSYNGGPPDKDTMTVLELALKELEQRPQISDEKIEPTANTY